MGLRNETDDDLIMFKPYQIWDMNDRDGHDGHTGQGREEYGQSLI